MTYPFISGEPPDIRRAALVKSERLLADLKKLQDAVLVTANHARMVSAHLSAGGAFNAIPSLPSTISLLDLAADARAHAAELAAFTELGHYSEDSGSCEVKR